MKIQVPRTKRFRVAVSALGINFAIFILGIFKGVDLSELGVGLAALNAPIYMYILGETYRPSK